MCPGKEAFEAPTKGCNFEAATAMAIRFRCGGDEEAIRDLRICSAFANGRLGCALVQIAPSRRAIVGHYLRFYACDEDGHIAGLGVSPNLVPRAVVKLCSVGPGHFD